MSSPRDSGDEEKQEEKIEIRFFPPVGVQRYGYIADIVKQHECKSLIDIGAGPPVRLLHWLKQIGSLRRYIAVDLDTVGLRSYAPKGPFAVDYLSRTRTSSLNVDIYSGSLFDIEDTIGVDCAVLCEVIEHVDDTTLVTRKIFGTLHCPIVVVTTPNKDFNRFFPDLQGFRHSDHRFEWTRMEFKEWSDTVCRMYGYDVRIDGIGTLPDCDGYGCCTQVGVFRRRSELAGASCLDVPRRWIRLIDFVLPGESIYLRYNSILSTRVKHIEDGSWQPIAKLAARGLLSELGPIALTALLALHDNYRLSSDLRYFKLRRSSLKLTDEQPDDSS